MNQMGKHSNHRRALTLIELLVVVLIITILSSIGVGVFVGYAERAKVSAARATITSLELAITRYEIDLGAFPPSSSGTIFGAPPSAPNPPAGQAVGCGYLTLTLLHSMNGNATAPLNTLWFGPYMEVRQEKLGESFSPNIGAPITETSNPASISFLDPWGRPYVYLRNNEYVALGATEQTNTPFANLGEVFYNPATVQIYSLGPNGATPAAPQAGLGGDDINNFNTP